MALPEGPALRWTFGETLADLANEDRRIVVLDGDVGNSTGAGKFETAHPERYLQMGIAEQNMVGVAAGLATLGFVPFVTTFACFAVARAGLYPRAGRPDQAQCEDRRGIYRLAHRDDR